MFFVLFEQSDKALQNKVIIPVRKVIRLHIIILKSSVVLNRLRHFERDGDIFLARS